MIWRKGETVKRRALKQWKQRARAWLGLILNWRFPLCFGIAWLITNGWSYALLGIGLLTDTSWMITVAGAYLAFLWLPISPEKVATVAIALFLFRRLFPKHIHRLKQLQGLSSDASASEARTGSHDTAHKRLEETPRP